MQAGACLCSGVSHRRCDVEDHCPLSAIAIKAKEGCRGGIKPAGIHDIFESDGVKRLQTPLPAPFYDHRLPMRIETAV